MNFLPVKIPEIFKTVFPNRTWYIDTDEKVIYLTPEYSQKTPEAEVLDELNI